MTFLANGLTIFFTLAATASSPINPGDSGYHGVFIYTNTAPHEPVPVEIYKLTSLGNEIYATELIFDHNVAINVDINSVECRAYRDEAGVMPGSAPFTNRQPAKLSTNLVHIQSIICYITET